MGAKTTDAVALLRGINVGGKNKLPMKDLAAIFDEAGCADVRTYIQSGNVLFRAGATLSRRIPGVVAGEIERRFGYRVPVIVRTAPALRDVLDHNPFLRDGADPKALHVAFLADKPDSAAVRRLDPDRSPPDEFAVRDREIYLWCPNGVARTKLSNRYFDSELGTTSTVRNWATVTKLVELV